MLMLKKIIVLLSFGLVIDAGAAADSSAAPEPKPYSEPFRPQYHFTPERHWMNDPNGLIFLEGEYHMFYQYNPLGDQWGHMSWGHTVSSDLVHWKPLPVAIPETNGIMIFSGSAVVDWKNSSGFGKNGQPPLVATYTGFRESDSVQYQCVAYSNDRGRTWTQYAGNPVLDLHMTEFRDPKVQWYEPAKCWLLAVCLSAEHKVQFYHSTNLKDWRLVGDFGPAGATGGVWECVDLVPVAVEGKGQEQKWVLVVNISGGGPTGQSGTQYFIGDFDGSHFSLDPDMPSKSIPASVPNGQIFADFEGPDYGDWKVKGTAFGPGPAQGQLSGQNPVDGFAGHGLVNSFLGGDGATGTLTSPLFRITNSYINFLIGGGSHADVTCMNLLVDGKVVRTATGHDVETLNWTSWNVEQFRGRPGQLQIVDEDVSGWGHINIDQIIFADAPAIPATQPTLWLDQGSDLYATARWNEIPKTDGRQILIGWINHWPDGIPGVTWRGAMSVPRELTLRPTSAGLRLVQQPIRELAGLRGKRENFGVGKIANANAWLTKNSIGGNQLELNVTFKPNSSGIQGIKVFKSSGEETLIGLDAAAGRVFLDRTKPGAMVPSANAQFAPIFKSKDGDVKLHIFLDGCTIEVFVNDGEASFTDLVFPNANSRGIELFGSTEEAQVANLEVWSLKSIWK
jgi:sucrose-6-phosphate hydrolase SacC (GH32 family)